MQGLPRHVSLLVISYLVSLVYAADDTWLANALLNQRDIASVLPIDRALWYGLELKTVLFASNQITTANLKSVAEPLAAKYQRLVVDLYWDAQNKDFQMCPAPYPSVIPSPTPTMLAATAAAVTGTATTSRAPSPTSTGTDSFIAGYNCSNSIRTLSDLLPYIASYMSDTSSRLAANVVFLVFNLHDLGITPTAGAAATTKTLSSTLLATIGNSSIYTPQDLAKHRSSVNDTWGFVSPYYVTSSSGNITSTSNGWPVAQYLTLTGKRLLVAFGTNTISSAVYDTAVDANTIFSATALASVSVLTTDTINTLTNCSRPTRSISMTGTGSFDSEHFRLVPGTTGLSYSFVQIQDSALTPFTQAEDLAATIWTWDVNEPSNKGRCAVLKKSNGRWAAADCDGRYAVACRSISDPYQWVISGGQEYHWNGDSLCPMGYRFAVPRSPIESTFLYNALAGTSNDQIWIDYNSNSLKNCWVVGGNTKCPYYDSALIIPDIIAASLREGLLVVVVAFIFLIWQVRRQASWRRIRMRRTEVRRYLEQMEREFTTLPA
ncbi:hypothetical protein SeLEV6574_g03393 [Synchytrium endobioticum]|uniref:Maintenance of telomere capping protein 6 n=1 Tax=Synchytrium endobioticum TaxID=286115 RepID=A0A507D488_9FUNG|nr:hypothetical protein SeLEV6574_g03393 [Synchytrium endobioticum]